MPRGRARILVVHPDLRPPGGGNTVAAWTIQTLSARHDLTVLSWRQAALEEVNRFYGTSLAPGDFTWRHPPPAARALHRALSSFPPPLHLIKTQLLARHAKALAPAFDLLFSTENDMDLGGRGLQYIHFPTKLVRRRSADAVYQRLSLAISGYDHDAMRKNLTLVNSEWTGRGVTASLGIPTIVLYPPVVGDFQRQARPWAEREDAFVALGRFVPEKRIDLLVDIVAGLRKRGFRLRLHLVGNRMPGGPTDEVLRRARAMPWVELHEDLARDEVLALLGRARFGLHGMTEEHFGIAVAEMTAAGCIPFIPASGGQVEIVDHPALVYEDREQAIERIVAVLGDEGRQAELRRHLAAQAERFGAGRFGRELLEVVERMLAERAAGP